MTEREQRRVVLHGAIILLVGNLLGFPLAAATAGGATAETLRAWNVAHSAVTAGGVMLVALGLALRHVSLGPTATTVLVWSLLATGYGAIVSLGLGALAGVHGFRPTGPPLNLVAFLGNGAVVWGSLVGVGLVIRGLVAPPVRGDER